MIKDVLAGQVNRTFKKPKKNMELEKFELVQFTAYFNVFNQKSSLHKQ